jgi:hypothetical protein
MADRCHSTVNLPTADLTGLDVRCRHEVGHPQPHETFNIEVREVLGVGRRVIVIRWWDP